jgi:hypothetical protein
MRRRGKKDTQDLRQNAAGIRRECLVRGVETIAKVVPAPTVRFTFKSAQANQQMLADLAALDPAEWRVQNFVWRLTNADQKRA